MLKLGLISKGVHSPNNDRWRGLVNCKDCGQLAPATVHGSWITAVEYSGPCDECSKKRTLRMMRDINSELSSPRAGKHKPRR
jgi:transcription elongation factor Elf1